MARRSEAVSRRTTTHKAHDTRNDASDNVDVLYSLVDDLHVSSSSACTKSTDSGHDDIKVLRSRNMQPYANNNQLIAFCAESLSLYLVTSAPRDSNKILRISLLAAASAGILAADHRLSVPGLVSSILVMLFARVARVCWKIVIRSNPDIGVKNTDLTGRYVIVGASVGVSCALIFWKNGEPIFAAALGSSNVSLFIINALASALALILGKSLLFPMDEESAYPFLRSGDAQTHPAWNASMLVILVGIVGCYSTLSVRRSYTSVYQLVCFWFAIAMICIEKKAHTISSQSSGISHNINELVSSSEDNDSDDIIGETHHSRKSATLSSSRRTTFSRFVVGIAAVSLWTVFIMCNTSDRPEYHRATVLDREYRTDVPVEIVLSIYGEPIEEVVDLIHNLRKIPALSVSQVTIYIKDSSADNALIKSQTGANQVIILPNVGREGETYLNHILNRWDSLAHQTVFLQASIHNPRELYKHVRNYYIRSQT